MAGHLRERYVRVAAEILLEPVELLLRGVRQRVVAAPHADLRGAGRRVELATVAVVGLLLPLVTGRHVDTVREPRVRVGSRTGLR